MIPETSGEMVRVLWSSYLSFSSLLFCSVFFVFCVLCFVFCVLCFVFCVLCFVYVYVFYVTLSLVSDCVSLSMHVCVLRCFASFFASYR